MGYSKGGDSKSKNTSTTVYPGDFLAGFENRFGRGIGLQELAGMLPQSTSLFGGGGSLMGPGGQQLSMPGAGGAGAGVVPWDAVNSVIQGRYMDQPDRAAKVMDSLRQVAGEGAQGITLEQLQTGNFGGVPQQQKYLQSQLPAQLQQFLQPAEQRFTSGAAPDLSALQIPETIRRLFGADAMKQATPFQFQNLPAIQAPTADAAQMGGLSGVTAPTLLAAQMGMAPSGYARYEDALFQSMYNPQAREINRQGDLADRRLQAELAGAGLASSGSGIGQLQESRRTREQDLQARAADAARQATVQRQAQEFAEQQFNTQLRQQAGIQNADFDMQGQQFNAGQQFAREQFNATQRQATNLANAGFSLDAQKANAANILAGDTARADNYLRTLGLNEEMAKGMRGDFLNLLGITQKELERLDASQMEKIGVLLNNWLQQGALLGNLGQRGSNKSSSSGGSGGGLTITGQGSTT